MAFAEIPEKTAKMRWLSIRPGEPVLFQILDDSAYRVRAHQIHTSDNKWVKIEHDPDSALMNEAWFNEKFAPRWVYRTNVLEVTPYVLTSNGKKYPALGRNLPERDPQTGEDLRSLPREPLNEVKILERGVTLFTQLNDVIEGMLIENPDTDIHQVVFQLQASGKGLKMVTTIYPRPDIEPQPLEDIEKYDLEFIKFTDEEVSEMLRGVGLMDIFAKRKETTPLDSSDDGKLDFEVSDLPGL